MYRPNSLALPAKLRIDYTKTLARTAWLFKNPESIRPDAVPAHLAAVVAPSYSFKLPLLKGNVMNTLKELVVLFIKDWREAEKAINFAIRTNRTALAKRCGNWDPKTAYRHILCLIEHGFLRAKVQIKGGLQLLLNPDLFVFEKGQHMTVAVPAPTTKVAPAAVSDAMAGLGAGLSTLMDIGNFLNQKFSQNAVRRT